MAEPIGDNAELDAVLRDALQRAAQHGDSTGVADAIRSRIAAGDPGTSVAGSTAPGWGGGAFSWMPWLGLVVLAGIGGTALGASGVIASEPREIVSGYTAVLDDSAPAASCPGGPVIGSLSAGDRVLAVARSEDSGSLGVRDPNDFARTLWFDRAVVVVDAGQADVDTLPVEACPVATVTVVEPTPEPIPGPIPEPGPAPAPGPGDTTAPSLGKATASGNCVITVTVPASDNVAVTGVTVTLSGANTGSHQMTHTGGGVWQYQITQPPANEGNTTFTMVARDGAGNTSSPAAVTFYVVCLI